MSFLAPLYALAALAIGLPLLFHLIQRRPRGVMQFSSLMFLSPSPPRLTRRSRLNNILLLLLRALAIILLAVAFCRPLWRSVAQMTIDLPAKKLMVLVDTSASMQRGGIREEVSSVVDEILDEANQGDQIALYSFDSELRSVVAFDNATSIPIAEKTRLIRNSIKELSAGWSSTNLGKALSIAADTLHQSTEQADSEGAMPSRVVVITDLQSGSDVSALNNYEWPEDIQLEVRRVAAKEPSNVRGFILEDESSNADDGELRVRVVNAANSTKEKFVVGWVDDDGNLLEETEYKTVVPAGESRVIRVSTMPVGATQLQIDGDGSAFDNSTYVVPLVALERKLVFVGSESSDIDPRSSLIHYLRRAPLQTRQTKVVVVDKNPGEPIASDELKDAPLVVVAEPILSESIEVLRKAIEGGTRVLVPLTAQDDYAVTEAFLAELTNEKFGITEGNIDDYRMFSSIDYQHPLFAPFNDPKFNDFTKIKFWSYRKLEVDTSKLNVLATFDDSSPAIVEKLIGSGRIWILAAGWQPDESQLALSSKFVPLLATMFAPPTMSSSSSLFVGDDVALSDATTRVATPDGETIDVTGLLCPEKPGIYRVAVGEANESALAVNIQPDESKTEPMDIDQLSQFGISIGRTMTNEELESKIRQMRDTELESQQKLWRWLIVAVIAILAIETMLASWLARQSSASPVATQS